MNLTTLTFQTSSAVVSVDGPFCRGLDGTVRPTHGVTAGRQVNEPAPRQGPGPSGATQPGDGGRRSEGSGDKPGPLHGERDIRLHVEFREGTGELVFEVRDHRTGETIRQFPPEALLDAGGQLQDLRGILINEQA